MNISLTCSVPGIGQKYGQLLADHGFIYARQLLGYYLILKDSEMFRKWLEYRFHIPRFRAAESKRKLMSAPDRVCHCLLLNNTISRICRKQTMMNILFQLPIH